MAQTLLVVGLACLIAAIVGGGLTAFQVQLPALQSGVRQAMLATLGVVLIAASVFIQFSKPESWKPAAPAPVPVSAGAVPSAAPQASAGSVPTAVGPVTAGLPTAPTAPTQPAAQQVSIGTSSFVLPDEGFKFNNATVGPFCCTGTGVVVRSSDETPLGYIYFYSWTGQAYNIPGDSVVPNISILVSGPSVLGGKVGDQVKSHIDFIAGNVNPQSDWTYAGLLQYRATLLKFNLSKGQNSQPYFLSSSLKVRVEVRPASSG